MPLDIKYILVSVILAHEKKCEIECELVKYRVKPEGKARRPEFKPQLLLSICVILGKEATPYNF